MRLKAKDQIHLSSVKADTIRPNEEFEVSGPIGKDLVSRGLASEVRTKRRNSKGGKKPGNKAAPMPENKSAQEPENKSAS